MALPYAAEQEGVNRVLTEERHEKILELLKVQGSAAVTDLAKALNTSESTIRRDLVSLDRMNKLKKVHGGATALHERVVASEPDFDTKMALNMEEKTAIGRAAAGYIQGTDFVYLDAGTTTALMIDFIPNNINATFVTNGIAHARMLVRKGIKVYVVGGRIKQGTEAIVGAESVDNLKKYNFTKAFIGTNGIDAEAGFTTPDIEEALLKKEAVQRSFISYILADSSKFDKVSAVKFAELKQCCIITDVLADVKYREHTVIKEVSL